MDWIRLHSKSLVQLAGAILMLLAPVLTGHAVWTDHNWVNFAAGAIGLVLVYAQANTTATISRYAKFLSSAAAAGFAVLYDVIGGGVTSTEWWQIAFAVLAAAGVLVVPTSAAKVYNG